MAGSGGCSEEDLLQEIVRGTEQALETLYQRHAGQLFAIALNLTRDNQVAEEVIQDVFVRVWRLADRYDPSRGGVFTWLLVMTRNRCIDHLRTKGMRSAQWEYQGGNLSESELVDTGPGVQEQVESRLERQHLLQVMASLPEEQRFLLEAAFFEGWSHRQLAEQHGLPLGTVKSRLRRGIERLRDGLSRGKGEPSGAVQ